MCNSPEIMCNFQFTDGLLVCLENVKKTITFNVNNMFTKLHPYTRSSKEVIHMYTLHTLISITVKLLTVQYCTVLYCTVLYCTVLYTFLICTVL